MQMELPNAEQNETAWVSPDQRQTQIYVDFKNGTLSDAQSHLKEVCKKLGRNEQDMQGLQLLTEMCARCQERVWSGLNFLSARGKREEISISPACFGMPLEGRSLCASPLARPGSAKGRISPPIAPKCNFWVLLVKTAANPWHGVQGKNLRFGVPGTSQGALGGWSGPPPRAPSY